MKLLLQVISNCFYNHHIEVPKVILSFLESMCDATREETEPYSVIPNTIMVFGMHFLVLRPDKASKEKKVKNPKDFSFQPIIVISPRE